MSYSFSIKAASKDEAKAGVDAEMAKVVQGQSVHSADAESAVVAASTFIDLLADLKDGEEIRVSVHGSLGWNGVNPEVFSHANIGITSGIHPIS